jgi:heme/copper-type cytochrome/quinol oxidase subunit 2
VDFFAHQDQARRNTLWLILYFVLTVITIMATVYFASVFVLFLASKKTGQPIDILTLHPQVGMVHRLRYRLEGSRFSPIRWILRSEYC